MKKIRLLTLLVLGLLIGGTAYAQSRVSGVVKSSEDGQPLAGVVVQIKGTTIGALTGADGTYTINNASVANSTLVFSYAGMRKQEIPVAGKSTINVTMQPDALQAEAVTVTALGGRKQ
ncbi:carboxypeptidase-like regulatory domain-containing protein, partial [Rikenella microfusus]